MGTLSSNLTKIKNATDTIRTVVDMPTDDITDVATAVQALGSKNAFEVSSITEMKALSASEGDLCTVHTPKVLVPFDSDADAVNVLIFPESIEYENEISVTHFYKNINLVDYNYQSYPSVSCNIVYLTDSDYSDGQINFTYSINNYEGKAFSLFVDYEYVKSTHTFVRREFSCGFGASNLDITDGIVHLPISIKYELTSDEEFFDPFRIVKTFDTMAWDPLTYADSIIFKSNVPNPDFSSTFTLYLGVNPNYHSVFNDGGAIDSFCNFNFSLEAINLSGTTSTLEKSCTSHVVWDFDYLLNSDEVDFQLSSGASVIGLPYITQCEIHKDTLSILVPVRLDSRVCIFSKSQVSDSDIEKLCNFFMTYKDGSYTNYVYHDNKWNIIYD